MNRTIRIFIPIDIYNSKDIYCKGYVHTLEDNVVTVYMTKYSTDKEILQETNSKMDIIYGYSGNQSHKNLYRNYENFISIRHKPHSGIEIKALTIHGNQMKSLNNCVVMLYDYNNIRDSQTISNENDDYLSCLVNLIKKEHGLIVQSEELDQHKSPQWLASSMFLQHVYNYWRLVTWLTSSIRRNKRVTVKHGNLIVAILTDVLLGYIVLQLLSHEKKEISELLMGVLEKLINSLYSLLKWLMGAPVGLKLNKAFNNMLGKYFSYHVQLWWLFLDVSGEKLDIVLQVYHYVGYLGLTIQTAMISDLICTATFHSYCIYVYAARLFNIQILGLVALLRLFVGRKYNPLRGGIDSCEYTNLELFVGTVAFTILLLLLPTTALYYIVFTMFRVLSLAVQYFLAKIIYMIQTLPLYCMYLRITNSRKVTGKILIEESNKSENSPVVLKIKLLNKSIPELVHIFKPPVQVPNQVRWTNLFSNVFIGKQIV